MVILINNPTRGHNAPAIHLKKLECLKWLSLGPNHPHILPKLSKLMRFPISIQRQIHHRFSPLAFFSLASPTKVCCPSKPYLRKYLAFAMASEGGDSKSISTVVDNDEDVQFGFKRSEMYSSNLAGTVGPPYERHVFLCYKAHESWPSRVEDSEADLLPKLLAESIKTRKADMKVKVSTLSVLGFISRLCYS